MTAPATLRQSAMRGGAYLIGRQMFAVILKLVGIYLITRILGPTQYGSFIASYNVYNYALLLGQAGVGVYLLRHDGTIPDAAMRSAYSMLLAMAVAMTLALEFSRPLMIEWTGIAGYGPVMTVMALALPFHLLAVPPSVVLERALEYRSVALIEIGGDVVYYGLAAVLVLSNVGPVSLGVALLMQRALFCILAHRLSRTSPKFGWDRARVRQMIAYAGTFSLANWIWQLRMLVNPFIVAPALGANAVGLIGMTIGILEMLSIIKTVAWRLSVSVLGRVQSDLEKLRRSVTEGMELQTLAVGAILLGFGWVGRFLVPVVFGARWAPVMEVYPYIALSYLTVATFNVHSAVMSVIDRNRDLAFCYGIHIVLFAGTAWYAVPRFGIAGYGIAEIAALPAYLFMHLRLARAIGSPDYRLTAWWWAACVVGLFWQQLGPWAIAVPFLALLPPASLRRIRSYAAMIRKPKAPAPAPAEAA